jgi:hypothetical protein
VVVLPNVSGSQSLVDRHCLPWKAPGKARAVMGSIATIVGLLMNLPRKIFATQRRNRSYNDLRSRWC